MTFTNQFETNEKDTCYYRKAYSSEIFETLSLDEKYSLIAFTVEEFSNEVKVIYSDELCDEIGVLTGQDVLLINGTMLREAKKTYSLELYLFLYNILLKRFVARKKNDVPVIEECYINKKWRKKDCRIYTWDSIVLHLLLDELIDMNEVVLANEEERKCFLGKIENISTYLFPAQDIIETMRRETPQERSSISEASNVHVGRNR